jgi:hypothetical protein
MRSFRTNGVAIPFLRLVGVWVRSLPLAIVLCGHPAAGATMGTRWFDGMSTAMEPPLAKHKTVGIRSNWGYTDLDEAIWDFGMGLDMAILHTENESRLWTVAGRWSTYSRFQYNSDSFDLWTTDFRGGVVLGYARDRAEAELFIFHESSHLGDEIQERGTRERRDVSKNGARVLVAKRWSHFRLYSGLTYLPIALPSELETVAAHLGLELTERWPRERGFIAVDTEWWEYRDWQPDFTFQVGLVLGFPERECLWMTPRAYLQFYSGQVMLGQFYDETESHVAFGVGGAF